MTLNLTNEYTSFEKNKNMWEEIKNLMNYI